jgi:L-lactate dehydrogenase complex protein LldG
MQIFKTSKAKENILRKIRASLQEESLPVPYPEVEKYKNNSFFHPGSLPSPEENFAAEFTRNGGHFVFCNDGQEAVENLISLTKSKGWNEVLCANKRLFSYLIHQKLPFIREFNPQNESASACITDCEAAVARTGSIFLSSRQNYGRVAPVYFPVHIVLLFGNQVVPDIEGGLHLIKQKYKGQLPSQVSLVTGPSRSTNIEHTDIISTQGPRELFCFFLNNNPLS